MPNISAILRSEIARIARKAVRAETLSLKKAVGVYRTEIAELKRRTEALDQELRRMSKAGAKAVSVAASQAPSRSLRFSAKGLAAQRQRLGLSASDFGRLIGASGQSIYNWEQGKARPQARHLHAIAVLRNMGKREAAASLAAAQR